jgi:biopolymer transport protein ExbD
MKFGSFADKKIGSPLTSSLMFRGSSGPRKRSMNATLLLTSMVDIMTILVVFLLFDASTQTNNVNIDGINMPKASQAEPVPMAPVLRFEKGRYFIDDKEIQLSQLPEALKNIRVMLEQKDPKNPAQLIVLADRAANFENLNPIMLASSEAGLQKFRFAVIQEESKK